jgi:hypothetical protein
MDGKVYKGSYKDDKKHGFGSFTWENGRTYEGDWFNGKQHGKGVLIVNGEKKEGMWENGKRVKFMDDGNPLGTEQV